MNASIAQSLEDAISTLARSPDFDDAAFDRLVTLTSEAGRTFRIYEGHHRSKDGPDRSERADRNADIADRIERTVGALSAWRTLG